LCTTFSEVSNKNISLLKNLFEANRRRLQALEKPLGAGDEVYKASLPVRASDKAKTLALARINELLKMQDQGNDESIDSSSGNNGILLDTVSTKSKIGEKRKREDEDNNNESSTSSTVKEDNNNESSASSTAMIVYKKKDKNRTKDPNTLSTVSRFKFLLTASNTSLATAINAITDINILKAVIANLAARRRFAYGETARMARGLQQRTAVAIVRTVGSGNLILLPGHKGGWFKTLHTPSRSYMQTISHAKGIDALFGIASRHGVAIIPASEEYTSRECSCCRDCDFHTGERTFTCPNCGLVTHRDAGNSPVNIQIRAIALGNEVYHAMELLMIRK
jgi:hypothetical protein